MSTYSIGSTVYQRTNTYTYATNGIDLLTVTNALGVQVASNAYNTSHQVVTNFNALGEKTVYTYNANQQVTSVTRPTGLVTTNYYDGSNQLTQTVDFAGSTYFRTNAFTYTNGLIYTQTDERGLTITNTWDALQRLRRVDFPDGTSITNMYDKLDLVRTIDRMGFTNSFGYNAIRQRTFETNTLGVVTAYGYCQCGALDHLTNALGKPEQLVTHYVHDNQGNVTSTFYPDGSGMTNKYDSLGRVTNVVSGFASVTNYFNNQGLLITASNAFGQAMSMTYDVLDRATNSVDGNGVSINSTYDNLNRLLTRGYPDGGGETNGYTLNVAGVTSYTNQLGSNVVNYAYDAMGRKTNEVNPGISTNKYTYSAASDLLTLTDGKNQTTTWNYDQYGRTTNKVDATSTEIFRYQYDADNRLTNRWSAARGNTTYKFDAAGNLTNIVYPVSPTITLQYDALNRLTNMTDAAGTTVYTYANQFLASEDGPWYSDTVSYSYTNSLRGGSMLLAPNASSWTQSYGYDAANRLQSVSSPVGTFTYTFKGPGNLFTNLSLPNGAAITNVFDNVARLTGTYLKNSGGTIVNSHAYGYNLAGQRTTVTNFTGNYFNYTYDNVGELKTAVGKESGGASRLHEQFGYAYDATGNLNYRTNNSLVQTFGVNNLNELTTITRSGTLTVAGTTTGAATNVTIADNGNSPVSASLYADSTFARTNVTVLNGNNTFTAIAQDSYNRTDTNSVTVNLPATASYIYDLNGNLTSDGVRGFDYDDENQLIRVTVTNSWKTEFTYDGKFRRRIRKEFAWSGSWVQTDEVHYIYDGNTVIQWRDANNLPTLTLTRTGNRLLARSEMTSLTPTHAYFHTDGNGNITALVNSQQIVVARYVYDPFGNTLSKAGSLAGANLYRFSSQEYHQNSGLILYLRRAYDPNLQRWLSRDPIAEQGGINLYRMCGGDPINTFDPDGRAGVPTPFQMIFPATAIAAGARPWTGSVQGDVQYSRGVLAPLYIGAAVMESPRVQGGLKVVGGSGEMVVGGTGVVAGSPTVAGSIVSGVAVVHGADTFQSGLRELWTGQNTPSFTEQGISYVFGPTAGRLGNAALGIALSLGSGLLTQGPIQGGRVTQFFNPALGDFGPGAGQALSSPVTLGGRIVDGASGVQTWVAPAAAGDLNWFQRMMTGVGSRTSFVEFDATAGELSSPGGLKSLFSPWQQVMDGQVGLAGRNAVWGELGPNFGQYGFMGQLGSMGAREAGCPH